MKEKPPIELADEVPGEAPTDKLTRSLRMQVTRRSDGKWSISAPWLKDTVVGDTWEDAYWLAMRRTA